MIEIYDLQGNPQSWAWLVQNFGPLVLHPAYPDLSGWRITTIRVREGPASIICTFLDREGNPAPDVKVAWYWPDADPDPNCGPANGQPPGMVPDVCDLPVGRTNAEGIIGHPMGGGAWYVPNGDPPTGPHATWAYGKNTNSDLLLGLGMVKYTAHRCLNLTFQHTAAQPPDPTCPWEQIHTYLDSIEVLIAQIRALEAHHATQ